jgi:catechol 1,2-dioxygenase
MERSAIDRLLGRFAAATCKPGNERITAITNRVVSDLFHTIEDFDVQPSEFWTAINYLQELGRSGEWGLLAAGLGFETYLDERMDDAERRAGLTGGTPRTIEGPLYVAGAPVEQGEARLDDGTDTGETLLMSGRVIDVEGKPVAGAHVEVWHANTKGMYSVFDTSQSAFNLRRTIVTDNDGRYAFRSIMPSGYSVPPGGGTEQLLDQLGRHGHRPAHIHFFVSAPRHRKLTTQINIDGDQYLHDDFAFATRDGLIPPVIRVTDPARMAAHGLNEPFATISFDFVLQRETDAVRKPDVERLRAAA